MFTSTKVSSDSVSNSVDNLLKSFNSSSSSKGTSELYKADNSNASYKNDNFKNVLNLKSQFKDNEDTRKVDSSDENKTDDIDKVKEELEELEKKSKTASKEDASDILAQLLNLLNKLGIKYDLKENSTENSGLSNTMEKLMELLKTDSAKTKLDIGSLKLMEKLVGNLNSKMSDDKTGVAKGIKGLMSEISNMLDKKENQNDKVLTLEDMLSKTYSQDSSGSESNDSSTSKDSSNGTSKEDKFLNSLVNDNKDSSSSKINLFSLRTATVQNQGVNNVRGLTINKATFADDLIKDVKFMNNNSLRELTVKVNPGDLGEITIKLVQEDGVMKANLKANSKETTALLSQNLSDIKKQLSEQNLKIADVNIELYQDDTTFFSEQSFSGQFSQEQRNGNPGSTNNNTISEIGLTEDELDSINTLNDNNLDFFA